MIDKTKCPICKNTYARSYCDYCKRAERWDRVKCILEFTPRLQKDLNAIEIEIDEKELTHVRDQGWLFLTGKVGCGKTLYAINLVLASLKKTFVEQNGPKTHKFITVQKLLKEVKDSFDPESKQDPIEFYSTVDFLVLDDLGTEKLTEWTLDTIFQIINHRYEYLLPTIFTSNLSLNEVSKQINDRMASRIKQMAIIKKMKDIDYRLN